MKRSKTLYNKQILFYLISLLMGYLSYHFFTQSKQITLFIFLLACLAFLIELIKPESIINLRNICFLLICAESLIVFSFSCFPQIISLIMIFFIIIYKKKLLRQNVKIRIEHILLAIFLLINFVSIMQSIYIEDYPILLRPKWFYDKYARSIIQFFILFFTCVCFYLFSLSNEIKKNLFNYLNIYVIVCFIVSIYGLYCFAGIYINLPFSYRGVMHTMQDSVLRVKSVMKEPLFFAHYVSTAFFISIGLFLYSGKKKYILISFCIFISIVLSISRGAFLALGISFLLFIVALIIFKKKLNRKRVSFLFSLIFIIFFIMFIGIFFINYYYDNIIIDFIKNLIEKKSRLIYLANDISYTIRKNEYNTAFCIIKEHPFLGVGVGNLWFHTAKYSTYLEWLTEFMGVSHANIANLFLHIFASNGIIGGGVFVLFIIFVLFKAGITIIFEKKSERVALLLSLFFAIICNLIQYQTFYANLVYFWILLGLLNNLSKNTNNLIYEFTLRKWSYIKTLNIGYKK